MGVLDDLWFREQQKRDFRQYFRLSYNKAGSVEGTMLIEKNLGWTEYG